MNDHLNEGAKAEIQKDIVAENISTSEEHLCECGGVMGNRLLNYLEHTGDEWVYKCPDCKRVEVE